MIPFDINGSNIICKDDRNIELGKRAEKMYVDILNYIMLLNDHYRSDHTDRLILDKDADSVINVTVSGKQRPITSFLVTSESKESSWNGIKCTTITSYIFVEVDNEFFVPFKTIFKDWKLLSQLRDWVWNRCKYHKTGEKKYLD